MNVAAEMNVAFVGCGYVADFYAITLKNYPALKLVRAWDRDVDRLRRFTQYWDVPAAWSLEEVLRDPSVDLVVNLTNPSSHYDVTRAALKAGKHVYSEKPLAMDFGDARELVDLAARQDLLLSSAPCTVLGEAAQTAWKALRAGRIGTPRLVYAELDDGPIYRFGMTEWRNASGASWPYFDELQVGCSLEHSGYYVSWLIAMFGPVKRVTTTTALIMPDKGVWTPQRPDLSIGVLEHSSGVVARITCGLLATPDHRFRVFGDEGELTVSDAWNYGASVTINPYTNGPRGRAVKVPLVRDRRSDGMDFARGISEMDRLSASFSLHLTEVALALDSPGIHVMTTSCESPDPMDWAKDVDTVPKEG